MYEIHLSNDQLLLQISEQTVASVVRETLQNQCVVEAEIVVALVDDRSIHAVNREHLQHDYPTDVISFLYDSDLVQPVPAEQASLRGAGQRLDGELVVSAETAIREASVYGWNPLDELRLYLVHGLLHLCGYDDLSETEQSIMREQERNVLKKWGLSPHYS